MNIEKLSVGAWFQRTTLHLSEIYDFLKANEIHLNLNAEKLARLRQDLNLMSVEYKFDGLEYLEILTSEGIACKIYEDGLIVISHDQETPTDQLKAELEKMTNYYEHKLSPALNYVFSLGAPIPKELANIENVYPYFMITNNSSDEENQALLADFSQGKYYEVEGQNFKIYRGDKLYLIDKKGVGDQAVTYFIEEQIFLREFKAQLHRYLNIHRTTWEKVDEIKAKGKVKGKELEEVRNRIEAYDKTINLIETRINQMSTYLYTRERIAKQDEDLKPFMEIFEYRYEALHDTLVYVQNLWIMTKNYVNSMFKLLAGLYDESTQNLIEALTIVTAMGTAASLFEMITATDTPTFTVFGIIYFLMMALLGFLLTKLLETWYRNKKYNVSDVDFEKKI